MLQGYQALTAKEKETLRLILHGHDAKSMARELDLSVHTVNERLRAARRKLAVTSSKQAARVLLEEESADPQFLGDRVFGDADAALAPQGSAHRKARTARASIAGGILAMSFILAIALATLTGVPDGLVATQQNVAAQDHAAETAARGFLAMIDRGDWAGSYAATTAVFRGQSSQQVWTDVSQRVRPPLGALVSRTPVSTEWVPTPEGYVMVKYRSDFADRRGVVETVTLVREVGGWKVSGITIE